MRSTTTYHPQLAPSRRATATAAGRVLLLILAAGTALAFAVYCALALSGISQTLTTMQAALNRTNEQLGQTNAHLTLTTRLLRGTEQRVQTTNVTLRVTTRRLGATNGLLIGTNGKLDGMSANLRLTVRGLALTNGRLKTTNTTLRSMQAQIEAMTRKITHAKLLF